MSRRRALICGVSGQDGAYLARLLLEKGYDVYGTSRDAEITSFDNLARLGVLDRVQRRSMSTVDFRNILAVLSEVEPEEIYNLTGPSSVGLSFGQPVETMESIGLGTLNLLEAIRFLRKTIRLYNASSSECFGDTGESPANEGTPFHPRSPYAVAKSAAHWAVVTYRESYGLFACNGILFNHESPLRPARFVTRKIVRAACDIKRGIAQSLKLGNLDVARDWGAANEYVDAMWRMLQVDEPQDFVIATGRTHSLKEFVATTFDLLGLDWLRYVSVDDSLMRPSEILYSAASPLRARQVLDWEARSSMRDVVAEMIRSEFAETSPSRKLM